MEKKLNSTRSFRTTSFRPPFCYLLLAIFLILPPLPMHAHAGSASSFLASLENQMIMDVNQERTKRGFSLVIMDEGLRRSARAHSREMSKRHYFSHTSPVAAHRTPPDRIKAAGVTYLEVAENISRYETFDPKTALSYIVKFSMDGLMNSPEHKKNILHPAFNRIGIGILYQEKDGKRDILITQHFATKRLTLLKKNWEKKAEKFYLILTGKKEPTWKSLPVAAWLDDNSEKFTKAASSGADFTLSLPWPSDKKDHVVNVGVITEEKGFTVKLQPADAFPMQEPLPYHTPKEDSPPKDIPDVYEE